MKQSHFSIFKCLIFSIKKKLIDCSIPIICRNRQNVFFLLHQMFTRKFKAALQRYQNGQRVTDPDMLKHKRIYFQNRLTSRSSGSSSDENESVIMNQREDGDGENSEFANNNNQLEDTANQQATGTNSIRMRTAIRARAAIASAIVIIPQVLGVIGGLKRYAFYAMYTEYSVQQCVNAGWSWWPQR